VVALSSRTNKLIAIAIAVAIAIVGYSLYLTLAAGTSVGAETEGGVLAAGTTVGSDTNASGGKFVTLTSTTSTSGGTQRFPGDPNPKVTGKAYWGASHTGNGDVKVRHENIVGKSVAIHRTFFDWGGKNALYNMVAQDHANNRLPLVSIKSPNWADTAAGMYDTEIDAFLRKLDSYGKPVWYIVNHEPENNLNEPNSGSAADWRAMQKHYRDRMKAVGTKNVTFTLAPMGYTWNPASGRNPDDYWVPNTWDVYMVDYYCPNSTESILSCKNNTWSRFVSWVEAKGLPYGVAEWGCGGSSPNCADNIRTFWEWGFSNKKDFVGYSYFDSGLNGGTLLSGEPLTVWRDILGNDTRIMRINQLPTANGTNTTTHSTATSTITVPAAGTYKVWSRIMAPNTTNNSYSLQIDNGSAAVIGDTAVSANTWVWVARSGNVSLSAGSHTLKLTNRENGVKVDKVLLLADTACTPTGLGTNCTSTADTAAPTASVASPSANTTLTGTVPVSATATDNVGVTKVEFYVDNAMKASDSSSPFSYSWSTTTVANGTHTIGVKAYDAAGNTSGIKTVSVTVKNGDITPPSSPTGLSSPSQTVNSVALKWNAASDSVGVTRYDVFRNGTKVGSSTSTSYNDSGLAANTTYSYRVAAFDAVGNGSTQSPAISVTTQKASGSGNAPSAPTNLTSSGLTSSSVVLSWKAAASTSSGKQRFPGDPNPLVTGKAFFGASNENIPSYEKNAGKSVSLFRKFYTPTQWGTSQASNLANLIKTNWAADRMVWASFKPPKWSEVAAGTHDSTLDQMLKTIDAAGHPMWLTFHHEPENDEGTSGAGSAADFVAMQKHIRARMTALSTKNIALAPVYMCFHINKDGAAKHDRWWPGSGVYDIYGFDCYQGKAGDDLLGAKWQSAYKDAEAKNMPFAVAEYGLKEDAPNRLNDFWAWQFASTKHDRVGISYWDTAENALNLADRTGNRAAFESILKSDTRVMRPSQLTASGTTSSNSATVSYLVQRDGVTVGQSATLSYTDKTLVAGTTYAFRVLAVDANGNTSQASNTVSVTTPKPADSTAPTVPTGLTTVPVSQSQINLSWNASTDNVGVAEYQVFRNGSQVATSKTLSFGDTGLTANTTYQYSIKAVDAAGNVSTASTVVKATTLSSMPSTSTAGLWAEYFNNTDLSGVPAVSKHEAQLSADWGAAAPVAGVGKDNFSVRWSGRIKVPKSGTYTLYTKSDDGTRLWINDQLVIDDWRTHSVRESSISRYMTAGVLYDIRVEYFEEKGDATANLLWSGPGLEKQVIPAAYLSPQRYGLTATYYSAKDLTSVVKVSHSNAIDYDWQDTSPLAGVPADDFSVRWSGQLYAPTTGTYRLVTASDDGVKLTVGGKVLFDDWREHGVKENAATINLVGGQSYPVVVDYYEAKKLATIKLLWTTPDSSDLLVVPQLNLRNR